MGRAKHKQYYNELLKQWEENEKVIAVLK